MILEVGFSVLIMWSWPGDGPKDAPELIQTAQVYQTVEACEKALTRDWAQLQVELKLDAGFQGSGRAMCRPVIEFNRREMSR